jgi:hypothetical protein
MSQTMGGASIAFCGADVLRRRGLVPVATKVCIGLNFDGLVSFGIVDDPVILGG